MTELNTNVNMVDFLNINVNTDKQMLIWTNLYFNTDVNMDFSNDGETRAKSIGNSIPNTQTNLS